MLFMPILSLQSHRSMFPLVILKVDVFARPRETRTFTCLTLGSQYSLTRCFMRNLKADLDSMLATAMLMRQRSIVQAGDIDTSTSLQDWHKFEPWNRHN